MDGIIGVQNENLFRMNSVRGKTFDPVERNSGEFIRREAHRLLLRLRLKLEARSSKLGIRSGLARYWLFALESWRSTGVGVASEGRDRPAGSEKDQSLLPSEILPK